MDEKTTRIKLEVIAESGNKCWLNGKITRDNPLTGHHIIARRNGGATIKENIAPIVKSKHETFNIIERKRPIDAEELTAYMLVYKGIYPEDISNRIDYLMSLEERNNEKVLKHKRKYRKR